MEQPCSLSSKSQLDCSVLQHIYVMYRVSLWNKTCSVISERWRRGFRFCAVPVMYLSISVKNAMCHVTSCEQFPFYRPTLFGDQYNGTNMMHFSFNLLRIKGLYMFRALLAHPQESLHKTHLLHCVCIMLAGCGTVAVSLQLCHSQLTLYARSVPNAVCVTPPKNEQVMLETCRGPLFSINWMKSASRLFHYTDVLWCTVSKILFVDLMTIS
jgi:hypothetical protein